MHAQQVATAAATPSMPRGPNPSQSPVAPPIKPSPLAPYQSRFRYGAVTAHMLQLVEDAAHQAPAKV